MDADRESKMTKATSRGTRKEDAVQDLKGVIRNITKAIDAFVADKEQDQYNIQAMAAARKIIIKNSRAYIMTAKNTHNDEIAISLLYNYKVMIQSIHVAGMISGWQSTKRHIKDKIAVLLQSNTSNARRVSLEIRSPIKQKKKNITIDVARSYVTNHPNENLTRNALMVQIRSDIEKQCKSCKVSSPSQTSISNYLKEAELP